MKTDVLTIAAVIFFASLLLSSVSFSDYFSAENDDAPAALQQGVALR